MDLVCLPSDALSQHLLSYLGFSYLGSGVSLYGCSNKVQLLLLTLEEGYLLTSASPDLECGVALLRPPAPCSSRSLEVGLLLSAAAPALRDVVAPLSRCPWPRTWGSSSRPPPVHCCSLALSVTTPDPRFCAVCRSRRASDQSVADGMQEVNNFLQCGHSISK